MSRRKIQDNKSWFYIIPVIIAIAIVPLIVRVHVSEYPVDKLTFFTRKSTIVNLYTYYKSMYLIVAAVLGLVMFYIRYLTGSFRIKALNIKVYYLLYAYLVLVTISYFLSTDRFFSTVGYLDRHENVFVLAAYVIIFIYTSLIMETEREFKILIGCWLVSIGILFVIGLSQYLNHNLLTTEFFKYLLVPASMREGTNFKVNISTISQTLFNPNYVSFYAAVGFPFFFTFGLVETSLRRRLIYFSAAAAMIFSTIVSLSRNGIIGIVAAMLLVFGMLLFSSLKHRWLYVSLMTGGLIILTMGTFLSDNVMSHKFQRLYDRLTTTMDAPLNSIYTNEGSIDIDNDNYKLTVKAADQPGTFPYFCYDSEGNLLQYELDDTKYSLVQSSTDANDDYSSVQVGFFKHEETNGYGFILFVDDKALTFLYLDESFYFMNALGYGETLTDVPSIGFEGHEKLGSNRGYIWSRSLPLLKDYWLFGSGPDTYPLVFPQNDRVGKLNYLGNINITVDKPHNFLLDYAINTGIPAALALAIFWGIYIFSSIKLYFKADFSEFFAKIGFASLASVVGYLGSAMFNDTNVNVTPVFWVVLGLGVAANRLYKRELNR